MKRKRIKNAYVQSPFQATFGECTKETLHFFLKIAFCFLVAIIQLSKTGYAQSLSINTSGVLPDSSAMLDVISANKGLLIPRVSLTSVTDTTTIVKPTTSLMVYNTNASITGGSGVGYYYYNGSKWMNFVSGTNNSLYTPLIIGGTGTTSSITYRTTTGVGTTGADHIFQVGNNGATEAMRVLNNGKVGIGTVSPGALLQVGSNHTTSESLIRLGSQAGQYDAIGTINTNEMAIQPYSYFHILKGYAYTSGFRTFNSGDYVFTVNNFNMLLMPSGGNVGIGVTNPTSILHTIASGAKTATYSGNLLTNTATSSTASITKTALEVKSTGSWTGTSASNIGLYVSSVTGGTNNYDAIFNGGGNIGIGTTSPNAPLQIGTIVASGGLATNGGKLLIGSAASNGPEAVNGIEFESNFGGTGYGTKLYTNNTTDYWGIATRYNSATWTQRLVVKEQTGNVGIGTTAPGDKLEIMGASGAVRFNTSSSSQTFGVIYEDAGTGKWQLFKDGSNHFGIYDYTRLANILNVIPNGNMALMESGGNVGIGTTSPNSTLQVAGSLTLPYKNVTSNYTVTATDYTIDVTTSCTITLPTAASITGRIYYIKANGVAVTMATTSSQTIDGIAPGTIASGNGWMVQSNGSNWIKIIPN